MNMSKIASVLLIFVIAATAQSPQKNRVPVLHSQNSFGYAPNEEGQLTFFSTYTRYTSVGASDPPSEGWTAAVLAQEFKTHDNGGECCWTRITVTKLQFVVGKDTEYKKRWEIRDVIGDEGKIDYDFYRILTYGCCGDNPIYHYYGLENGKEIYNSVVPILSVSVANSHIPSRYIAAQEERKEHAPVVIQYGTEEKVLRRYQLKYPDDDYMLDQLTFAVPDEEKKHLKVVERECDEGATMDIFERNRDPVKPWLALDPDPIRGFSLQLTFRSHRTILLPVEHDQVALDKVRLPAGFEVTEIAGDK